MNFFLVFFGSFGFTGFFPFAPASFASLIFAVIYLLPGGAVIAHPIVLAATLFLSIPVATRMEKRFGNDASCIVIDEVVGMQVIFTFARPGFVGVLLAFFLFRIFDVVKPFHIRISQNLPGGYGVVCDDLLAGLYVRLAMVILAYFFPVFGRFA